MSALYHMVSLLKLFVDHAWIYFNAEFKVTDLRLAGGSIPSEGLLEMSMSGLWGTICKFLSKTGGVPDEFPSDIICKQLGYL